MFISLRRLGGIRSLVIRLLIFTLIASQVPILNVAAQSPVPELPISVEDPVSPPKDSLPGVPDPFPDPASVAASSLVIQSVDPAVINAGSSDMLITLSGSGFSISSTVLWQTVPLSTTFLDDVTLSAVVPADLLLTPGEFSIVVSNSAPVVEESNSLLVTVSGIDPYPNEKLSTASVSFDWPDIPGALSYRLQLASSEDFASPLLDQETQQSAYLTETALEQNSVYFWRTSAWDGLTWSEWSPTWTFTSISPPAAPQLLSPLSSAKIAQSAPDLTWAAVDNGAYYRVQISSTDLFDVLIEDVTLIPGVLDHTATSLQDGRYYWRVCTYDDVDVQGAWSEIWSFKIDTVPPSVPAVLKPADGVLVQTTTPKLVLAAVSGARLYHFQVAADTDFLTLLAENTSVSAQDGKAAYRVTAAEALPFGRVYWRARAVDAAGNTSAWTAVRAITVNILKTPSNKTNTTSQKPTFTWSPAAGAQQYRLQISRTAEFNADNGDILLDKELSTVTSFVPGQWLPFGKYFWRLQVQTTADWSNWTPAFSLTITSSIPMTPVLSGPASGALIGDSTPRLRWVEAFPLYAPQLRIHQRLIHVYLPPDYHTSGKSYPVIYLHDGVQMFNTDGNNEYHLDETLESLIQAGTLEGVIAVGIDHSDNRWDEFSPWINRNMDRWFAWNARSAEGGEGEQYLDFLINTLKPVIDQRYRTLRDRENTAIGGGCMGGIISLYAGLKYPQVFSSVIMFSPVLWFGEVDGAWLSNNQIINYINRYPVPQNVKFFAYIGTAECAGRRIDVLDAKGRPVTYPQVLLEGVQVLVKTLRARGVPAENIKYVENPGGVHQPYMWGYYFDDALLWLYKDQVLPDYVPPQDIPAATGSKIARYQVQVSRTADFSRVIQSITVEEDTAINADLLPKDGNYYWRARAVNDLDVPGAWSQANWFSLDTVPAAPTKLVSPADGTRIRTTTPLLKVAYVSGASRYHIQVASDADFNDLLLNRESTAASTQLSAAKALPFGQVYWRARTLDLVGNPSAWTEVRTMHINILKSPADGTAVTDTTPSLSWSAASGALKYHLQVALSADFPEGTGEIILDELLSASSLIYSPPAPLAYGRYYWRLQVKTSNGWSNWTPVYAFDLSTKPVAPVLEYPINKVVVPSSTPKLTWEEVTDPVVPVTSYLVQVSYSSVFTPVNQSAQVSDPTYTTSGLSNGKYFWRVRAVNALGVKGKWSATAVFKIAVSP